MCLFRKIKIEISSRNTLRLDLEHWELRITRASSFKYVRQLEIYGYMPREHADMDAGESDILAMSDTSSNN